MIGAKFFLENILILSVKNSQKITKMPQTKCVIEITLLFADQRKCVIFIRLVYFGGN